MEEDATDEAQKAPPEEFFHIFINNEEWLVKLLEYVIEKDPSEHDSAVYNTLLELYLQDDVCLPLSHPASVECLILTVGYGW